MENLLFTSNCSLNERIAQEIFDTMPESGPIMMIVDKEGHSWTSNSEEFSKLNISDSFFRELFTKIDDGVEPVITEMNDCSIAATQLTTGQTDCGYAVMVLPRCNPESTLKNVDLIETLLNQSNLIATLIENNNLLHELQMKQLSLYTQSSKSSN